MSETGVRIDTYGFGDTLLALSSFDQDMSKRVLRDLRQGALLVSRTARANAPRGKTGQMQGGYRTRTKTRGTLNIVQAVNLTPQGNILEFAGSTSSGSCPQGRSLIRNLTAEYGQPGRFLWEAWDDLETRIRADVDRTIADAEADLQAALSGADR